jgi:hypothetical protein
MLPSPALTITVGRKKNECYKGLKISERPRQRCPQLAVESGSGDST